MMLYKSTSLWNTNIFDNFLFKPKKFLVIQSGVTNFTYWSNLGDICWNVVENFRRRIIQIFWSIIHTQVIKVRAQLFNFLDIWVFQAFFCQFSLWMIIVWIILDAQMVSLKITPNLTKNRNLPKTLRLYISEFGLLSQKPHNAKCIS